MCVCACVLACTTSSHTTICPHTTIYVSLYLKGSIAIFGNRPHLHHLVLHDLQDNDRSAHNVHTDNHTRAHTHVQRNSVRSSVYGAGIYIRPHQPQRRHRLVVRPGGGYVGVVLHLNPTETLLEPLNRALIEPSYSLYRSVVRPGGG